MKRKRTTNPVVGSDRKSETEENASSSSAESPISTSMTSGNRLDKRKPRTQRRKKKRNSSDSDQGNPLHFFTDSKDVHQFRVSLLQWYDENKRDLPWRKWANHLDPNQRAYGVWVSEIMCQQTQVATVIDYYNRWMEKWPTLEDLAISGTLEKVNEMWAGLGYYSRGRRLYEGAKKVYEDLSGMMPRDVDSLIKELPGVGRYTAGAIASIVFNQTTGVVDGNVIRVLSRARAIGADSTSQQVQSAIWSLANTLVDEERPGDFNQAVMELGATVCTPKAPSCTQCPVKDLCRAFQHTEKLRTLSREENRKNFTKTTNTPFILPDIECVADGCQLCIPSDDEWHSDMGVMNFPRKPKKKPPRKEKTAVCIVERKSGQKSEPEYLLVQRPKTGLLAGLWEFPSVTADSQWTAAQQRKATDAFINDQLKIKITVKGDQRTVGEVVHNFSHIEQTYCIESFTVRAEDTEEHRDETNQPYRWFTAEDLWAGAVSTAMKKCLSAFHKSTQPQQLNSKKFKKFDSTKSPGDGKKQSALEAFFKPVQKKR